MNISSNRPSADFSVSFVKRRVLPITQYGKFRGRGQISIDESFLRIQGARVYSAWIQALIGLLVFCGQIGLLTAIGYVESGQTGLGILILAVSYLVPSYWIVRKEDLTVPFSAISALAEDRAKKIIAIAFTGSASCSPIVMKLENHEAALHLLKRGMSSNSASER